MSKSLRHLLKTCGISHPFTLALRSCNTEQIVSTPRLPLFYPRQSGMVRREIDIMYGTVGRKRRSFEMLSVLVMESMISCSRSPPASANVGLHSAAVLLTRMMYTAWYGTAIN